MLSPSFWQIHYRSFHGQSYQAAVVSRQPSNSSVLRVEISIFHMESPPPGREICFLDLASTVNNGYGEETRSVEIELDVRVVSMTLVNC